MNLWKGFCIITVPERFRRKFELSRGGSSFSLMFDASGTTLTGQLESRSIMMEETCPLKKGEILGVELAPELLDHVMRLNGLCRSFKC